MKQEKYAWSNGQPRCTVVGRNAFAIERFFPLWQAMIGNGIYKAECHGFSSLLC